MMGELLEMDVVNVPTYDGFQAASTSIRMAYHLTGRNEAHFCGTVNPDKLSMITNYCMPDISVKQIEIDRMTGIGNFSAIEMAISNKNAVVYFENPSYLGMIPVQGAEIAHEYGVECVVGVDPISLGMIAPPTVYCADIVCGDISH